MRLAVIADVHGNAAALSAVLADLDDLGITEVVNLGDHLSGPLDAATTADLLMQRAFHEIRGNHDRALVETAPAEMGASDRVAHDQLDGHHMEWLRSLPPTRLLWEDVFLCHGTPTSDVSYWLERVEPDGAIRPARRDEIQAELGDIPASLFLCAHTHIPRIVQTRCGRTILNPGSVGCPGYDDDRPVFHEMQTGTPNASYAIVEKGPEGWSATFRSLPYAWQPMAELAASRGRAEWSRALSTGWVQA
ncbi:MAG: metallophosphoesterase family protein [Pseudomonadota bacterium]